MVLYLSSTSSCITKNWLQEPFSSSPPPPHRSVFCPNALPACLYQPLRAADWLGAGCCGVVELSVPPSSPCSATSSTIDRSINLTRVSIKDTKLNKLTGNGARLLFFFVTILLYIFFSGIQLVALLMLFHSVSLYN